MGVKDRERSHLIREAWVKKVDLETMTATIEYLDMPPGTSRSNVIIPSFSAGRGWGAFSGIEEGSRVLVGHTRMSQPVILGVLPIPAYSSDNLYRDYPETSIMTDNKYQRPRSGEIVLQGKGDSSLVVGNNNFVAMKAANDDQIKIDGQWRSLVAISEQAYLHTATYDVRAGTTKRDINRIRSKEDAILVNMFVGDDSEQIYEPIGKCLFEDGSGQRKIALASSLNYIGHTAEVHKQSPVKCSKNEAFAECRVVFREFSPEYLDNEEEKIRATENDNYFNLMRHRNNILELSDNDLAEIVFGPLVDINGLLLDINYMPLDTNIFTCPKAPKETVFMDGVSISGKEDNPLTLEYPTRINAATIFNFQLNTLGTDYKREMHWSLGKDGKKVFEGLTPGNISKYWAYDTALDSGIWDNINKLDLVDLYKTQGAFIPPKFQFSVDKNGAVKIHVPTSSLEHPVMEWVKWDLDPAAEVLVEKGNNDNYNRTKTKNENLFNRIKRYGGELYHPVHQTSLPTIGGDFRVIEGSLFGDGGFTFKNFAMISPIGVAHESGQISTQGETNVFDNSDGRSHNPAYCPIGQSAKIGLDGRIDLSVGRDHADWKSLVADLRGGAVLRIGRMYDEQSCECVAEEPWGVNKIRPRVGKANDNKIFNDRRSVVFETDGIITGTIGRSIERELSLDLNTKAGIRLHVGKANYGIPLTRKLIQYSRDYDPHVQYDPENRINVGYKYFESSRPSKTWDEFNEERHDKIAHNPRLIDGTFVGSVPGQYPDANGKATPDSTNAVAEKSLSGGSPREHHSGGYVLNSSVPDSVVRARTMHWLMEEVAHVVNNAHRQSGLGSVDSDVRNNDSRLPIKMDARDTEAGSININTEADALITLRDDLDYVNMRGNRTSLRLDTSGQIVAWIGADVDDYRSISLECDGGVQAVVGKTKAEGKSVYGLLKGGVKLLVGVDNQNVEHNTDEGLVGYPSPGQHSYNAGRRGTGRAMGGRKYADVGYHPFIHKATTYEAGAVPFEPTDDMWAADLNGEIHYDAIQHVDLEGTSVNIKTQGSTWFTIGMNNDSESVVVDTAGSFVTQLGTDKYGRSAILHADGSMKVYLGKEIGGDSLHVQMAGGANIAIKHDGSGNAVMLGIQGDVVINIDGANKVITNINTNTVEETVIAKQKISHVIACPKTEVTYTGDVDFRANSIHVQTTKKGTVLDL